MARKKTLVGKIKRISGGLAVTTLDLAILAAGLSGGYLLGGWAARSSRKDSWKIPFYVADWIFGCWDNSKLRRTLGYSLGEGLFEKVKDGFQLTTKGRKRLEKILPSYKRRIKWNGTLWLIIYDISDNQRHQRDYLRKDLVRIGCGMIQKSVWLSVKDPRKWLIDRIQQLNLKDSVIISHLSEGSMLGEEDLPDLINRVFKLDLFNERYRLWLEKIAARPKSDKLIGLGWEFLNIVRDDPMLPMRLLPNNWLGEKALAQFERYILPGMGELKQFLQ